MARMAKVVELPSIAKIDKSQGKISAQLTQALREAVQSGDLQPGDPCLLHANWLKHLGSLAEPLLKLTISF